jgi:mono/diheme cytochrome c family protein
MPIFRVVFLLACTAISAVLASGQVTGQRPSSEEGQRIFKLNCVSCHGPGGRGDGAAAAQLNPKPADLTSPTTQVKDDAVLLEVIKFGRPGTAMPSWMSELDERDMRNVLAYLRSLAS